MQISIVSSIWRPFQQRTFADFVAIFELQSQSPLDSYCQGFTNRSTDCRVILLTIIIIFNINNINIITIITININNITIVITQLLLASLFFVKPFFFSAALLTSSFRLSWLFQQFSSLKFYVHQRRLLQILCPKDCWGLLSNLIKNQSSFKPSDDRLIIGC